MDQEESAAYTKTLEAQLELRTRQLKQAVASHVELVNLVREAVPALRTVDDDPAAQKLLGMFGNDLDMEKIQATVEPINTLMAKINAGEQIPPVSANDIRQIWGATHQMNADRPPRPDVAIGLSVFAAYGVSCAAEPALFMSAHSRHMLLSDLIDRGLLAEWVQNGEPDERVFEVAATVDCTLEDLGRVTVKVIGQSDPEFAAHASEALRAEGKDLEHPEIDRRFLELLHR